MVGLSDNTWSSAEGSIALPASTAWHGSGTVSLWIGMGGSNRAGIAQWPLWQAGVSVTCSASGCTALLFDEGGTQGAPCNGVCAANWTQFIGSGAGDTIWVAVSSGSSGAMAVLTVDHGGTNTTYHPPPWSVLAGVNSFPYAEWIVESPLTAQGTMTVMPTISPPGVQFASMSDPPGLSNVGPIQMENNPNGQSVSLSSFTGSSFWAYPDG